MSRVLLAVLLGCLLTGCIYLEERGQVGDVAFSWTLNGWACSADPYVHGIRISIPGESLHNDGYFPCVMEGSQGMVLERFYPGNYSYTAEALGYSGELLYSASGNFYVDGYTEVSVNLVPALSGVRLSWNLMADAYFAYRCQDLYVRHVVVSVDGVERGRFRCEDGEYPNEVDIPDIQFGSHVLDVYAEANGMVFRYRSTFLKLSHGPEKVYAALLR